MDRAAQRVREAADYIVTLEWQNADMRSALEQIRDITSNVDDAVDAATRACDIAEEALTP